MRRFPLTRRLGLRARITLAFTIGALLLSVLLSITTLALTRENLLNQREDAATVVVYENAGIVQQQAGNVDDAALLSSLRTPLGSRPVLYNGREFVSRDPQFGQDALPAELRDAVVDGQPSRMRFELRGDMHLAVGIPIPSAGVAYFEIVSLSDLEDTLGALGVSLLGASLVTTLAGAGLGWWASRRALRPLAGRVDGRHRAGRRPARHPPRVERRPRPAPDRRVVQRHGPGPPGPHRERRPLRLRREPRAAVAAHDAGRVDRGDGQPARRAARARRVPPST